MSTDTLAHKRIMEMLNKKPSEQLWWHLVKRIDELGPEEMATALARIVSPGLSGMSWPATVERYIPLGWLQRLCEGEDVPEVQLANAIDLGNRLSLKQPDGFDAFFQIEEEQLDTLLSAPLGHIQVLSYSDEVGEHPYHPGFIVEPTLAEVALSSGPWQKVHTIYLNGLGVSEFVVDLVNALKGFHGLRRLELNRGDDQGGVDADALQAIVDSAVFAQLESFSVRDYCSMEDSLIEILVKSKAIAKLKCLELGTLSPQAAELLGSLSNQGVEVKMTSVDDAE